MEVGGNRSFQQRTGLEDAAHTSPVEPANFTDRGMRTTRYLPPSPDLSRSAPRRSRPPAETALAEASSSSYFRLVQWKTTAELGNSDPVPTCSRQEVVKR
jgi:hypothetical protein